MERMYIFTVESGYRYTMKGHLHTRALLKFHEVVAAKVPMGQMSLADHKGVTFTQAIVLGEIKLSLCASRRLSWRQLADFSFKT